MAETLLQKAQRLGIQPAIKPKSSYQKFSETLGDFSVGVIKGALEGPIETAKFLQKGGQAILAGLDPTKSLEEIKTTTGFESLKGKIAEEISGQLEAKNVPEKVGKVAEFVAELIWPGSKAEEVQAVLKKGRELFGVVGKSVETELGKGKEVIKTFGQKASKLSEKVFAESIPKPVENVLKETPVAQFDKYAEVGRKAGESYKNPTALEKVGERGAEALDTIQRKLSNIGSQKSKVLDQAAVGRKPVGNIVVKFRQNLNNFLKGKTAIEGDTKLVNDILSEAQKLGDNPRASDVDKFIDFIQDKVYSGQRDLSIVITDDTTGALRKFTGQLNDAFKSQLPESYKNLNNQFTELIGTRNELNLKLGKEGEKGGALMKRVFSPSDANTKKLFADVLKYTGIDLVNEATLARFVMEATGDARQASLLEKLDLPGNISKRGLLDYLFKKLGAKYNTPEAILERARELTAR